MSSSTARSLSARLWRWLRVRFLDSSSWVISGSMTVPPGGDSPCRVGELVEGGDPVLEEVADACGLSGE